MPFPASNPALERALAARAYAEPTPVQLAVLAPETAGRDMLVSAQTGSGKTVAFGLALAHVLLGEAERFAHAAAPLALIVAPTRELAVQVQRELTWLYAETGARFASCVGGMDPRAERDALAAGAHIVVGTPGRLRDHLERRRLDLSKLRAAVLDEADEMLDLGFRDDLQFILDATPAERQTLMFSATVPREIESLARSYQREALRIATAVTNRQHDDIEYRAVRTVPNSTEATVVNLLRFYDAPTALVFCATREGVRRLNAGLANRGFATVALSGELSQAERTDALERVRSGHARVLVATDVAARGLDLAELSLVIHADLPTDRETLLHRSGRTGRAGRKGISVLVVQPNRRRRAEELLGRSRIAAIWENAPAPRDIAAKDQERLLSLPILDEPATAEDLALGRLLLDGRTPEQVAAALVRMSRIGVPVAENLRDLGRPPLAERPQRATPSHDRNTPPPREVVERERPEVPREPHRVPEREDDARPPENAKPPHDRPPLPPRKEERSGRPEMVWFGLDIGRSKNADVRWLLPMICRVGEVTKREVGTIKVGDSESRFEIRADHADNFANAVRLSKSKEGRIWRLEEGASSAPAASAPTNERQREPFQRRPKPHGRKPDATPSHGKNPGKYSGKPAGKHPGKDSTGGNAPLKRSWKNRKQAQQ
jgi:ATP-dependent RNA helicase DeaD